MVRANCWWTNSCWNCCTRSNPKSARTRTNNNKASRVGRKKLPANFWYLFTDCLTKSFVVFQCDKFTSVKNDFVLKMLSAFNGALIPTAIACFFAENNFGVKLQKCKRILIKVLNRKSSILVAPNLDQKFWCQTARPLQSARQKKMTIGANDAQQHEQFKRYTELMTKLRQGEYASLITSDLKLSKASDEMNFKLTCLTSSAVQPSQVGTNRARKSH